MTTGTRPLSLLKSSFVPYVHFAPMACVPFRAGRSIGPDLDPGGFPPAGLEPTGEAAVVAALEDPAAAHPVLEVVDPVGVRGDRHHDVVALRVEHVALGHEDAPLVGLGASLIEPLARVVGVENDEVPDLAAVHLDDAQSLPAPDHARPARPRREVPVQEQGHRASSKASASAAKRRAASPGSGAA